ncbi:FkbM family methyltransferase [Nocardioides sp. Y6]|uniref:FkbM family methyltransferase n=1 Tax=Nocardioides malaquae TaxID=2773426 RepID=A0ABR9RR81_9ACTN|nr:FkbM family methyltransferase [Nocardioides malaquae]MBE7323655.1 FkbM family methyltransferase [Nocardioides malaquae]
MPPIAFDPRRVQRLIDGLAPRRRTRVVDVGANPVNVSPYDDLLRMGGCELWAFEPHPEAYEELRAMQRPHAHYLPYALGSGGTARLHVTEASGFTSLLAPAEETFAALGHWRRATRVREVVEVETHRLDDIAELPDFDLLKIDIQGGECEVFAHGQRVVSGAAAVISEVAMIPIYRDQPLLDEQMRQLRNLGFDLHKLLFMKSVRMTNRASRALPRRRFTSQGVDGDAVFVRGLLDLGSLPDEHLKHLAILADAVFGSHDLAVYLLGLLHDRGQVEPSVVADHVAALGVDPTG